MAGENVSGQIPSFPAHTVSDSTKRSKDYGLQVARAIEAEWWRRDSGVGGYSYGGSGRYRQTRYEFHRLRLYARGEQDTQKYRDEFAINGDLSYLNLDWKPVAILPKFVDILVNGMQDRLFSIKAVAQDPVATDRRTKFVEDIEEDMLAEEAIMEFEAELGVDTRNVPDNKRPSTTEELELYMQIGYKQGIEIAQEQAIDNIFMTNRYDQLRRRLTEDLVILGIACAKHTFNNTDGIRLDYVDPADLIYSYTEDPNFEDCYYFGEVKRFKVNELKKEFPHLKDSVIKEALERGSNWADYNSDQYREDDYDSNTLTILYFNWKTWGNTVYKVKETASGGSKALKKDDTFNPPKDQRSRFERVAKTEEVIYEGAYVLGTDMLLKWELAKNMVRPDSNTNKVMMNYIVSAPKMYKGRIESTISRVTTYADLIQLTHLKLQQTLQRLTPSGVYLDADGLAEIDLGNGTSYNPQEALNMYFQTGSVIGRSMTIDGDPNPGKIPIQELPGGGGGQVDILINAYNYYLQMIRDTTGLNEARDAADPDPYSLVGVQKLAAANSNTATRHILHANMYITTTLAEAISLRFKDVLEFHPTKEAFIGAIGRFSVGSLEELKNLHLHDFGIFLELAPDEEEKQMLEANIQQALAKDSITLEDAIDVRQIKNIKLANQLLKYRRKAKMEYDQMIAERNIEKQSEANAQAATQAEQAKAQAEQIKNESKIQLAQAENEFAIKKMEIEAQTKKELMQYEFQLNKQLKEMEIEAQKELMGVQTQANERMADKKNKADQDKQRIANQAKNLSGPPKTGKPAKSFESKGNDTLGSGFNLERFEPK